MTASPVFSAFVVDRVIPRSVREITTEKEKRKTRYLRFILHPLRDTLPTGRVSACVVDGRVKFKSDEPPLLTCGLLQTSLSLTVGVLTRAGSCKKIK